MLLRVDKGKFKKLERYQKLIKPELYQEIQELAEQTKGLRVIHLNATPKGGGVSEALKSMVPLMKGVGLHAGWYVVPPNQEFFRITKQIHNAIQGKDYQFSFQEKKYYIEYNQKIAEWMDDMEADIVVVHDPQPLGLIDFVKNNRKFISRMHIDSSSPDPGAWKFLKQFLEKYDRIIFHIPEFAHPDLPQERVRAIPIAIDPLSGQNRPIRSRAAQSVLEGLGIDTARPLMTQVSRFDPWKDPVGVVDAYRIARKEVPGLQLALLGLFLAQDDPEGAQVLKQVKEHAGEDPDIHLFHDVAQIGPLRVATFVNVFQVGSDVILQKSIKEGFGLTVAEAMWKRKPVIDGNVGGIKVQIEDGKSGYLVNSPEEAAARVVTLMKDSKLRKEMGRAARERVREQFLLPRLLRDYLKLFTELM